MIPYRLSFEWINVVRNQNFSAAFGESLPYQIVNKNIVAQLWDNWKAHLRPYVDWVLLWICTSQKWNCPETFRIKFPGLHLKNKNLSVSSGTGIWSQREKQPCKVLLFCFVRAF
jgi:hypothetical protein